MKIGLVCPYNIAKSGGVQEVVLSTKAELVRRGHQVKIITPMPRSDEVISLSDVIFVGNQVDYHSPMSTTIQVSGSIDIEKIDAMLNENNFDVLHFHEPWMPVLSHQLLQRSKTVNVATFHAQVPETLMSRTTIKAVAPYLKSVMKYLNVLTAVSPAGAEYAAGMTDKPITIIPNAIDQVKYYRQTSKQSGQSKTLFYIGRLEKRKGVKYLLQAYKLLAEQHPEVRLVIAGDGPERERLELLAEDLKLKNVSFLGYISEDLKLELLYEADLLCAPSIFGESFGIVLLEAMATGTVCVAGNNAGYSGLMQGTGALSIVNPEDAVEFSRRMETLLYEESVRKLWQKWAAKYVKQFNYQAVVDQYEQVYWAALGEYGPK